VAPAVSTASVPALAFEAVYDEHFDFVWRTARRLGVPERSVDDAVQDVFVVVYRRLGEFEGRSTVKTWLFGIARRVAHDHRRRAQRKEADRELPAEVADRGAPSPRDAAEAAEAARVLHAILDTMSDEQREVFVLAELEQMSAPEIAEAVGAKLNTVYSRLRLARAAFDKAIARRRAREEESR
jgi:RNA polymerase sigma-70 factor (ECF subfamily)